MLCSLPDFVKNTAKLGHVLFSRDYCVINFDLGIQYNSKPTNCPLSRDQKYWVISEQEQFAISGNIHAVK